MCVGGSATALSLVIGSIAPSFSSRRPPPPQPVAFIDLLGGTAVMDVPAVCCVLPLTVPARTAEKVFYDAAVMLAWTARSVRRRRNACTDSGSL
ncbi:hypothetical protein FRC08_017766 [Ceratobasidium sp. 394]|nr:hypothetical protein FRC08_017766 [Ceratobasidium sp. 394]